MARKKVDPHALGYRFYRGYIYRQMEPFTHVRLWDPWGRSICTTSLEDIPGFVDYSIERGLDKAPDHAQLTLL